MRVENQIKKGKKKEIHRQIDRWLYQVPTVHNMEVAPIIPSSRIESKNMSDKKRFL